MTHPKISNGSIKYIVSQTRRAKHNAKQKYYSLVTFTCVLKNQSKELVNFKKIHEYLSNMIRPADVWIVTGHVVSAIVYEKMCISVRIQMKNKTKRQRNKVFFFWGGGGGGGVLVRNHCLFQSRQPANLFSPPTVSLPLDCFNKKLWIRRWWVALPWCSLLKLEYTISPFVSNRCIFSETTPTMNNSLQ